MEFFLKGNMHTKLNKKDIDRINLGNVNHFQENHWMPRQPTVEHYHKEESENAKLDSSNDQWEDNSIPELEASETDCDQEQSGGTDVETDQSESDGNETDAEEQYLQDIETDDANETDAEEQNFQNNATGGDHSSREFLYSQMHQTQLNWDNIDSMIEQKKCYAEKSKWRCLQQQT